MNFNRMIGSVVLFATTSLMSIQAQPQQQLDPQSFVDLAMKGASLANQCSETANKIIALRVPPDHAAARAAVAGNAMVPSSTPVPISAENTVYLQQIEALRLQLASYARQFASVKRTIHHNATLYTAQIAEDKIPRADAQKVANAIVIYNEAHKRMVLAIVALSNDRQVESHVGDVIVSGFIDGAKN